MNKYRNIYFSIINRYNLPYHILDYIEFPNDNTGQYYFKTGLIANNDTEMYLDMQSNVEFTMFYAGSRDAYLNNMFCVADNFLAASDGMLLQMGNTMVKSYISIPSIKFGERMRIYLAKQNPSINDIVVNYEFNNILPTNEIYIGALNQKGEIESRAFRGKLFSAMFKQNSLITRDYQPIMMKDTKEVGVLDKVNDIFITNSGNGGNFTPGPIIW